MLEGAERAAVIQVGKVRLGPLKVRLIRDRNRIVPENAVVFRDDKPRPHYVDGFPDPIIVAVDVDGKQSQVFLESAVANEIVDILLGDERALGLQIEAPGHAVVLDVVDIFFGTVDHHSVPVVIHQQEAGITFFVVFHSELDERFDS